MIRIFQRKIEPTVKESAIAYGKICYGSTQILKSKLNETLINANQALDFSQIADKTIGFLEKDQRKLYDRALFFLINEMAETGIVTRDKFEKNLYKLTKRGKEVLENGDTFFNVKRKEKKDVEKEILNFFDSIQVKR